jgi:hypothetical protein
VGIGYFFLMSLNLKGQSFSDFLYQEKPNVSQQRNGWCEKDPVKVSGFVNVQITQQTCLGEMVKQTHKGVLVFVGISWLYFLPFELAIVKVLDEGQNVLKDIVTDDGHVLTYVVLTENLL